MFTALRCSLCSSDFEPEVEGADRAAGAAAVVVDGLRQKVFPVPLSGHHLLSSDDLTGNEYGRKTRENCKAMSRGPRDQLYGTGFILPTYSS